MALRYEWGFDVSLLGGLSVLVGDQTLGSGGTATLTTGTYCHTDLTSVLGAGEYDDFATDLSTELSLAYTGTVAFRNQGGGVDGYRIAVFGGAPHLALDFRTASVGAGGPRLAAALGFNYEHVYASGGSASSPYEVTIGVGAGVTSLYSNVRPYYVLYPTIEGRSQMSDEYEPEGAVIEAEADDGTAYYSAKDGVSLWSDWMQMAETDTPPSGVGNDSATNASDAPGAAVFKRSAITDVPWSFQHAWEHLRTGGSLPFLCVDGSDSTVHQMRADGTAFHPQRFASPDYSLWTLPFKTRQLGRL